MPSSDPWRLTVMDDAGNVVGGAVLVAWRTAITCAHVIDDALAGQPGRTPRTATLQLGSPTLPGWLPARVRADGWFPAETDGRGDVAVLELGSEPELLPRLAPAVLRPWAGSTRPVRVYGHPATAGGGVYARAVPVGTGGPGGERVQLDAADGTSWPIGAGFSGCGVAGAVGEVIGIVVAVTGRAERRAAWMIPVEHLARYWPLPQPVPPLGSAGGRPAPVSAARLLPLFTAISSLARHDSREAMIGMLPRQTVGIMNRHNQANFDILGILQACLKFDGGLAEFVEIIRLFEQDSIEMRALDAAISTLPPDAVR